MVIYATWHDKLVVQKTLKSNVTTQTKVRRLVKHFLRYHGVVPVQTVAKTLSVSFSRVRNEELKQTPPISKKLAMDDGIAISTYKDLDSLLS